jgi:adenylate cyclase
MLHLMPDTPNKRRLAAIVVVDVVGYSRLMEREEEGTLEWLHDVRTRIVEPKIAEYGGRLVKSTGDGFLMEFVSAVEALRCAMSIQDEIPRGRQADRADGLLRIGINLGDVIADEHDIYGDGVNVAARLEALAKPGGICISRSVRDQVRDRLSIQLDDWGEIQVKNISRPVRVFSVVSKTPTGTEPSATVLSARESQAAPRLSIVVLPLANKSNDPEEEYFADGVTEDLITDLSRMPGSFVIARSTAFTYKGRAIDAKQVGRELGVRYILEGSVRRAGEQVRVNVQLVDAELGNQIWADRLDTDRASLAEAQDVLTARLARALNVELLEKVKSRLERDADRHPDARDLVMRGWAWFYRPRTRATIRQALCDFEQALDIDAASIDARIGLAITLIHNITGGWSGAADREKARAHALLEEALDRDPNNSMAHYAMGHLRRIQCRLLDSRFAIERAIALNPNDAQALAQLSSTLIFLGEPQAAIPHMERAFKLSPRDPDLADYYWRLGLSHLLLGHATDAIDLLRKSCAENPRAYYVHFCLAGALGLNGELVDAKSAIEEGITLSPGIDSIARWREYAVWDNSPGFLALAESTLYAGLRRAGFPECSA